MKFKTKILQFGNNTGIEISEDLLEKLNGGKKPLVVVTLNKYSYRSAVGKMGDRFMISLSSENRKNAGVNGGDSLEVQIELDTAPRTVDVPDELQTALNKNKTIKDAFEKLAPSKKKAMVMSVIDAKAEETRKKRIEKIISTLSQ
ncbi:MAG TPA: YdeI/OmpD-associated family protein [Ignavibacteria bacterium]|nr:YdeI/OmpD-associated family protein [Ignavibacteria bacterium]HQY53564.1 YdeI/OmpD-associated family protein [Ignavibacteria bacterium]